MEQQRLFFVPFPRPDLIGRDEVLEQLHPTPRRGGTPALVGQGGTGKTQLAVWYCYDHSGCYPCKCSG